MEVRSKDLDLREKEIGEMRKQVEAERTKFVKKQDEDKAEIGRQWQKLHDEMARMEEIHKLCEVRIFYIAQLTFLLGTLFQYIFISCLPHL